MIYLIILVFILFLLVFILFLVERSITYRERKKIHERIDGVIKMIDTQSKLNLLQGANIDRSHSRISRNTNYTDMVNKKIDTLNKLLGNI